MSTGLMPSADFGENHETMAPFQAPQAVRHTVRAQAPGNERGAQPLAAASMIKGRTFVGADPGSDENLVVPGPLTHCGFSSRRAVEARP